MMSTKTPLRVSTSLLFGGAIAVASSAQAGITLITAATVDIGGGAHVLPPHNHNRTDMTIGNTAVSVPYGSDGYYGYLSAQEHVTEWTGSAFSFSRYGATISCSDFTSTGFSMSAVSGPLGNGYSMSFDRWFYVDSTSEWRLQASAVGNLHMVRYGGTLPILTTAGASDVITYGPYSSFDQVFTLGPGAYRLLGVQGAMQGDPNASSFVSFQAVPAPGAVALLGIVSLGARRRRR